MLYLDGGHHLPHVVGGLGLEGGGQAVEATHVLQGGQGGRGEELRPPMSCSRGVEVGQGKS